MDIDISVADLSEETRALLIRFQLAHLHYLTHEAIYDAPGHIEWMDEFYAVRGMFKSCLEKTIADIGEKLVSIDQICQESDEEGEKLVEAGGLNPDDYQSWFDAKVDERFKEVEELQNVLHRLSLRIADKRPAFFKEVH
jgi:hypothetical protein